MGFLSLITPLRKYDDYVSRASFYESFFMLNKAILVMEKAMQQPFTKREISSASIYLGFLFARIKDSYRANKYFNQGLEIVSDEQFGYSSNFKKILKFFLKSGEKEKYNYWLNNLLKRQRYDKRFKKLERFDQAI